MLMKGKRVNSKISSGMKRESGGGRCMDMYFAGRWWGGFAIYILK